MEKSTVAVTVHIVRPLLTSCLPSREHLGERGTRTNAAPSRTVGSLNVSLCPLLQNCLSDLQIDEKFTMMSQKWNSVIREVSVDRKGLSRKSFTPDAFSMRNVILSQMLDFSTSAKVTPLEFCEAFCGCFYLFFNKTSSLLQLVKAE